MGLTTTASIEQSVLRCDRGHVARGGVVVQGRCSKCATGSDLALLLDLIGDAPEPEAVLPPLVASDPMDHARGRPHPGAAKVIDRIRAKADNGDPSARQATGEAVKVGSPGTELEFAL